MNPESIFKKMRENEEHDKEDDPFDENNKEQQPFYRGCLIYKKERKGRRVEYFRLLKTDQFIFRATNSFELVHKYHRKPEEFEVINYDDWRSRISNGLHYTPRDAIYKEEGVFPELDEGIESDIVRYESPNSRQFGRLPRWEEDKVNGEKCKVKN